MTDTCLTTNVLALLIVLFLFLGFPPFTSVSAAAKGTREEVPSATPVSQPAEQTAPNVQVRKPRYFLSVAAVRPGEPITVAYAAPGAAPEKLQAVLLYAAAKSIAKASFFSLGPLEPGAAISGGDELRAAVLAVPSTAASGNAIIRIESANGIIHDFPLTIESREFPSEVVALNQENTELRTKLDPKKTAESRQLWAILNRTGTDIYSGDTFIPPVTSTRKTSYYGHRRVYDYSDHTRDTTIHAGVDYGVPTGTEVRAAARGKVVLAKKRIVTGNSVILEHLPGVYSLYYHLDTIAVSEGSVVDAGTLLGKSGSTGLATGPHLHWEIRVSGENADPDAFMARPVLDKREIVNKIMEEE